MTPRLLSLSFLLATAATAVTWLAVLPFVLQLIDAARRLASPDSPEARLLERARILLPYHLGAALLIIAGVTTLLLYLVVGRPLRRTEAAVEQLGRLNLDLPLATGGGPLLSRIQASLRRMAAALTDEQQTTRRQLRELTAANEQLRHAQAELVASERLATVGRLAAGVAHEVGNPLSGVLGYLSLAKARVGGDPVTLEYLNSIDAEVQRINGIVRGLLDLGRPPTASPAPVELGPLVRTCLQLLRAGPELREAEVTLDVPSDAVARADPGSLSQVLLNLLLNAGQAVGGKGAVRISAQSTGDRLLLLIDDAGPGLSPEVMTKLFQPFFTTKEAGKGTGLGLAVSEHLLRSMGGQLRAENLPGGGARFIVDLPRATGAGTGVS